MPLKRNEWGNRFETDDWVSSWLAFEHKNKLAILRRTCTFSTRYAYQHISPDGKSDLRQVGLCLLVVCFKGCFYDPMLGRVDFEGLVAWTLGEKGKPWHQTC